MKRLVLFLFAALVLVSTHGQFIHKIKADSVLITNDSCTAELNLENSTKHIKGFLYNKGNGRTEFRKAVVLNDSTFVFGEDTLVIRGSGGSAWKLTGNTGTNPIANFIGTTDNQPLVVRTNNLERMRASANGNIGIGTNNPEKLLHVSNNTSCCGGVLLESNFEALSLRSRLPTGFPGMRVYNHNGNTYGAFSGRNSDKQVFIVADSGDIAFWTGYPTVQRIILTANGKTGIGTGNPVTKLHVNGSLAVNKDSVPLLNTVAAQSLSVIDTTTGQVKRIAETNINPVLLSGESSGANVDIILTSLFSKGYDRIIIEIEATPTASDDSLHMRFSDNGGASFITSNDYNWSIVQYSDDGNQAYNRNRHDTKFTLAKVVDANQEGENAYCAATIEISKPFTSEYDVMYKGTCVHENGAGNIIQSFIAGKREPVTITGDVVNALRFFFSNGNVALMRYRVYAHTNR